LNHSEVVEAVERHRHHRPTSYVQFIEDPHPEGVVLYKDYNINFDGYPSESFAQYGSQAQHQRQGSFAQVREGDLIDKDIKSPDTLTKVEVKPPKTEAEETEDKAVFEANKAKAEKDTEVVKGPVTEKPAFDAMKNLKAKMELEELKNERDFVKEKSEDEIAKETQELTDKLATKAERAEREVKVVTLDDKLAKETEPREIKKLEKKLEEVKEQVKVDKIEKFEENKDAAEQA